MKNLEAAQGKMEEKLNSMTNFIDQELSKAKESPVSRRKRSAEKNPLLQIPQETVKEIITSMRALNKEFDELQRVYENFRSANHEYLTHDKYDGMGDDDMDEGTGDDGGDDAEPYDGEEGGMDEGAEEGIDEGTNGNGDDDMDEGTGDDGGDGAEPYDGEDGGPEEGTEDGVDEGTDEGAGGDGGDEYPYTGDEGAGGDGG